MRYLIPFLLLIRTATADEKEERHFVGKVLPVLREKCFACHGEGKKLSGDFDVRSLAGMKKGGDSGEAALVVGKPDESPLYRSVIRKFDGLVMPPKENDKLNDGQTADLRKWILDGAAWPDAMRIEEIKDLIAKEAPGVRVRTSGGLAKDWTDRTYRKEDLWAYQPLKQPMPPEGKGGALDRFIDAKLKSAGLPATASADRRTLIRRVTYDLTGLPTTPVEVDSFLADPSMDADAFAKLVDRLLASPHYGERMAQHWLDVTRYADSSGLANDYARGNAWRFRDYVVRSFNADKPYDRFVREQIAGDEIDPHDPEMLVAAGFLRMGAWELTGMEVAKIARQRFLDDVTDTVGQVFLGHTLQCCRCHDHKFDPVPTKDYYRIQAAFATTQLTERSAPFLPTENLQGFEERKYLLERQAAYEVILKEIEQKQEEAGRRWAKEKGVEFHSRKGNLKNVSEDKLPPARIGLSPRDMGMERIARKGIEHLKWELERFEPFALSVYSGPTPVLKSVLAPLRMGKKAGGELEVTHILAGGDAFSATAAVTPGILSAAEAGDSFDLPASTEGRRKALADWIVSERNPLAARVFVNRVWQWHFGTPLAGNPNNVGATGKKPTHPELLDWLACEFKKSGYSVKALHRTILLSDAYRRSSRHPDAAALTAKDPAGVLYACFPPRRLSAEELRDSMLAASGELNLTLGGIPVRPEIHPEAALQPRQVMGTFASAWQPSPLPEQRHRRTLYTLRLRGLSDPFLEVFNRPGSESPCEARERATVAPQALALLNGEATRGRALAMAIKLDGLKRDEAETIVDLFRLAFHRQPADAERKLCVDHWRKATAIQEGIVWKRPERLLRITREAVDENSGEKFSYEETLESAKDFKPDAHPAEVSPRVRGLMDVCLAILNSNEFSYLD